MTSPSRRTTLAIGGAALVAAAIPSIARDGFITITNDGRFITSPMPPDETIVEVRLEDGSVSPAWYSCNITEAGDWDFLPVRNNDADSDADSIADKVIAWRRV
jgi:hypothetical protein